MVRKSVRISVYALLTALPTALGYVLGPLTHSIDMVFAAAGVPVKAHLGLMVLVLSVVAGRSMMGPGSATILGVLLGLTGVVFHPSEPAFIRFPKDVLLGVGVDLGFLLPLGKGRGRAITASALGGFLSYLPYLLFAPPGVFASILYMMSLLILWSSYLFSCIIGGLVAHEVLSRTQVWGKWK